MELSTGDLSMVLDHSALMPAWSPNGRRIAYYGSWEPAEGERRYDVCSPSLPTAVSPFPSPTTSTSRRVPPGRRMVSISFSSATAADLVICGGCPSTKGLDRCWVIRSR